MLVDSACERECYRRPVTALTPMTRSLLIALTVSLAGCATRQTPNEDSGADSNGEASGSSADEAGEDDGGDATDAGTDLPIPCSTVSRNECGEVEGCVTVVGSEVAIEDSGAQLCGDLGFPIACADEGCEELDYAIVCNPDDPPEMFLVIGDCLPEGWSLCPNQTCG